MPAKWKKGPRFQPDVVLEEIAKIRHPKLDGKPLSFDAIGFTQTVPLLHTMLELPAAAAELDHGELIASAISRVDGELTSNSFLAELNRRLDVALAKRINSYQVLTTISLSTKIKLAPVTIDEVKIRFLQNAFPTKLAAERATRVSSRRVPATESVSGCIKIVADVSSKSTTVAFAKALRSIDLYRALWCFASNSELEMFGNSWSPINVVRPGGIHTVHGPSERDSGSEELWFEPHQAPVSPYAPRESEKSKKYISTLLKRLRKSNYYEALCDALILYVTALDEWNASTAFVKLWLALERLTSPGHGDYSLVVKRVSFLFKDVQFATQTMEHLREYRNNCIHSGSDSPHAKGYCYTLQHKFRELLLFHLRNAEKFSTLDEANAFLDLPADPVKLAELSRRIASAKRYRAPPSTRR